MTDRTTYVLPGINVYGCPLCSRKGNTVFVSVTLNRFYKIMIDGPEQARGKCNACKQQVEVTLERPAHPAPDDKTISAMIRVLRQRFRLK